MKTEAQIELLVERQYDILDMAFVSSSMTRDEYDFAAQNIDRQANEMYAERNEKC